MPGEHCPACGTDRTTGGCGCHPDVTETAVLPPLDGTPLVRPYAPEVPEEPADGYPTAVFPAFPPFPAGPPTADGHATTVLPPVGAGQPHSYEPAAPRADAHATTVLPPVPAQPPLPPVPPMPPGPPHQRELGLFPLAGESAPAPGRAASRRAARRGRPGVLAAAGAGLAAVGVGVAFLLSPSADGHKQALAPQPTGAPDLSPTPSPSAPPADVSPTASAAPATTAPAAPSAPRTVAAPRPTTPPAPRTSAPPAPTTAAPPPPTTAAPTSAAPSPAFQSLSSGMTGPDVAALQSQLVAAGCLDQDRYTSGVFDKRTRNAVSTLQDENLPWGSYQRGVYDSQTQQALQQGATC
ncbi:peptidoglycan-binding protein [Kitasatospora sp. NPDC052896]|uniref:peptidoglycan-binding protein n=1 Tax=Kitasatospora sp. NPDC052896 TaxID=3364061 RepID=UPI0037C56F22